MGLDTCECIATNREEYIHQAVALGINEKLKHKMNRNIEMNKGKIFQEQNSVDEWGEVLSKIC